MKNLYKPREFIHSLPMFCYQSDTSHFPDVHKYNYKITSVVGKIYNTLINWSVCSVPVNWNFMQKLKVKTQTMDSGDSCAMSVYLIIFLKMIK